MSPFPEVVQGQPTEGDGDRGVSYRAAFFVRESVPDTRWYTHTTQRQVEKRQLKVHMQRLWEDILDKEELDIQRDTQAYGRMARIHKLYGRGD